MASFIISFKVGKFGNHADRDQSVVQTIRNEAIDGATWEETSSFFVIQSAKTTTALTDAIYKEVGLVAERDPCWSSTSMRRRTRLKARSRIPTPLKH